MGEIEKVVGQWIVNHVGMTTILILFVITGIFKITKIEINPIGWIISWLGNMFTKAVRKDIADFENKTNEKFKEIKVDRSAKIEELKRDYDQRFSVIREDLSNFEKRTDAVINGMVTETSKNCDLLKDRLDEVERSNDMQTVRQIKKHVFEFANSCLNKTRHTKEDFDNIIKENSIYQQLVEKYGLVNDVYKEDYKYIMKIYDKCKDEHSFLSDPDTYGTGGE